MSTIERNWRTATSAAALLILAGTTIGATMGTSAAKAADVAMVAAVDLDGKKLEDFDISFVDAKTGRYYLADRSNASVDVVDTKARKFLYRVGGFLGTKEKPAVSGPDGVVGVPEKNQVWAGDGDSTVKVIDIAADPAKVVAVINTGGKARVDEMAYDPKDGVVLMANNADKPAFVSLVSTDGDHKIIAKLDLPQASDGVEQPAYSPSTGLFYFSVPILDDKKTTGAVGVLDPKTAKLVKMIPVENCNPTGLQIGEGTNLIVGCAAGSKSSGMSPNTVVLDLATEKTTSIPQVGGEDEVWYNPGNHQYYTASRDQPGGPVLGIIDATKNAWVANVPTAKNAHSVAADSTTNSIFVPLTPSPACANGCIGVYAEK